MQALRAESAPDYIEQLRRRRPESPNCCSGKR